MTPSKTNAIVVFMEYIRPLTFSERRTQAQAVWKLAAQLHAIGTPILGEMLVAAAKEMLAGRRGGGETVEMKKDEMKPTPLEDPDAKRPLLVSFAMVKRDGKYWAIAIESRGAKILREKVLESDELRSLILDTLDSRSREYWIHGVDPLYEREAK